MIPFMCSQVSLLHLNFDAIRSSSVSGLLEMGHVIGIRQAAKRFKVISLIMGAGGSYSYNFIQKEYPDFTILYINHNYAFLFTNIVFTIEQRKIIHANKCNMYDDTRVQNVPESVVFVFSYKSELLIRQYLLVSKEIEMLSLICIWHVYSFTKEC